MQKRAYSSSLPKQFLHFTNIAKDDCKGKRKSHFRMGYAEPYPIFYKYSESRKQKS